MLAGRGSSNNNNGNGNGNGLDKDKQPIKSILEDKKISARESEQQLEKIREKVKKELKDKSTVDLKEKKELLKKQYFQLANKILPEHLDMFCELEKTWNFTTYKSNPEIYMEMCREHGKYSTEFNIPIADIKNRNQLCGFLFKKLTDLQFNIILFNELLGNSQASFEEGDVYAKLVSSYVLVYFGYILRNLSTYFREVQTRDARHIEPHKLVKYNLPDLNHLDLKYKDHDNYYLIQIVEKTKSHLIELLSFIYKNDTNMKFIFNQE
ncbi:hypothetical protein CYY_000772 [Polysphondylium violaceum]|uniref:Uncharacterized protein n=1 Tax=Polysphondylium violaceum TaxID=133409 RepID=A0A8J4VB71_9MYCE|nr:hypothetical protein CYY_000772 [Polysphondylium violaceum]